MLHFKGAIPYTQTMIWFGLLAYFWVWNEIAYSKHSAPNPHLARAGAWSYSLYLVHAPGMGFYWKLPIPNLGYLLCWFATMFSSLGFSYLFCLLVERPAHNLARKITVAPAPRPIVSDAPVPQTETAALSLRGRAKNLSRIHSRGLSFALIAAPRASLSQLSSQSCFEVPLVAQDF